MKPQIIAFGLSGLVGSRIEELLSDKYEFVGLSTSNGVDITKPETLISIKDYKDASFVLHLAAKTNVDSCELDKDLGEQGEAWRVNVLGPKNVAEVCRETGKKIIYVSTDFVFDGEKPEGDSYDEEDIPNPINWYAKTKYEGERVVERSGADYAILRIAYPYRAESDKRGDFSRSIKEKLINGESVKAVTDHVFCPTFIDDLVPVIKELISIDAVGIYHAVGGQALSPYDAAILIAQTFDFDLRLINPITREEFFKGSAPRPFNLELNNGKIGKLGIRMRSFKEGIGESKNQLNP
ncbi:MAG: hypothetical protein A2186_00260 [Candidatus Levybacteria bacterium RIFOXYA1_FULL_41_10]|nr:MAG: dTDP-4-dehydrorhamnose reductase [Candidatus Levybacteria bacterium GW2011_GWA1_39_32]KKR49485.1 MAG: dTDP-4-dehydrorhamnose reductase [Candidatus Levybacteria bacterium GW2011_GWC1_40_19]KKR94510.1 MAG: dTDP-4-dehydrorhamnose reductase [Candidatus Levybacteria bacterium GW2011_GWA2_41_15]KKS00939.1 MAG: dTDP-4-dehydrorhamnose reductase [Candidatus Levybacteria bacterium GW2011_GWB1_41_21]OGH25277.1 MAG: hypothetical protein A3D82_00165 [Candidatus Levybacteria bacterium RIFCSPHIGHO2_02